MTLMATMPGYRKGSMEITARFSFLLADAIVLGHRLGLTIAANIILLVDPWCYPGKETPASAGIKSVLHSAVDKATAEGRAFVQWTAEIMSAYLLSPPLLPTGKRPPLVRVLKRAAPDSALGPWRGGGPLKGLSHLKHPQVQVCFEKSAISTRPGYCHKPQPQKPQVAHKHKRKVQSELTDKPIQSQSASRSPSVSHSPFCDREDERGCRLQRELYPAPMPCFVGFVAKLPHVKGLKGPC
jgi:hypothetical protein